jgi:polyisoprenoid-binding protein YceI
MSQWNIDPAHSTIGFKIKHLVVSTVKGHFNEFSGNVITDNDNFENAKIEFSAKTSSISTNNEARDNHLRSTDLFDSTNHPTMSFVSKSFKKSSGNKYLIEGDLTMRGVTKTVTLEAYFDGIVMGLYGKRVAAFAVTGTLNRQDYGVSWNAVMEAGGLVVANDVTLDINVELIEG